MKLSQLFTGETHIEEAGRAPQAQSARVADINRQIRALVPGQMIQGEILSRNGGEVQVKLADDMVLNAKVDRNIFLELGKILTFEVKNNGSALSLSPLFTNIATDVNVLKALDMAGLPVNETSVSMTEQLMEAGLPVNRNTLSQVYREINGFPAGEVSDVINLHKLQMPVNESNMQQMASYRNLTHQLINSMTSILDALPEAVAGMMEEGNVQGAEALYRQLFSLIEEGAPGNMAEGQSVSAELLSEITGQPVNAEQFPEGIIQQFPEMAEETSGTAEAILVSAENLGATEENKGATEEPPAGKVPGRGTPEAAGAEVTQTSRTDSGQNVAQVHFTPEQLKELGDKLGEKEFLNHLTRMIKEQWTLEPQELSQPGRVEELYRHLDRQLKELAQALETGGQEKSTAFKAVSNLSQNIDFLHQVNQMYTYVQLPLRLQQSDAHGDLYVYTNKRNLAAQDGKVSALLHLDMEHLGPLDVYVTLQESKVSTKFYVAGEEILDFIESHMDILTQRLQKRGYDCSFSMTTKEIGEKESSQGALAPLLEQEKGILLSQYAFDVRT